MTMAEAVAAVAQELPTEPCWADAIVPVARGWDTIERREGQCSKPAVYIGLCRGCYRSIFGKEAPVKKRAEEVWHDNPHL